MQPSGKLEYRYGGIVCPRCESVVGRRKKKCTICGQILQKNEIKDVKPYDTDLTARLRKEHRNRSIMKVAAVMVGLIVLSIAILSFIPLCKATLNISIRSDHATNTSHFKIMIDGAVIKEGDIAPGILLKWACVYDFPPGFGSGRTITVTASSVSNDFGDRVDSTTVMVRDGQTHELSLII